jgi:hypothetical protein
MPAQVSPLYYSLYSALWICRFLEIIITDAATGAPLDVPSSAFNLSVWTVHYPYDDASAARVSTQSPELNAVWNLCAYTVKATTLDVYAGVYCCACEGAEEEYRGGG